MSREKIPQAKRIVIKVGTSTLIYNNGKVNYGRIEALARVISDLMNQEKEIVLVSSGAIGVGVAKMNLKQRPTAIKDKQAVSAVGQCELMHIYSRSYMDFGRMVGQILLTRDVVQQKEGYDNVKNTIMTLLECGILPIVNENDSISVEEIKFGDNDTLSAIVSIIVDADLLIALTDTDGYYDKDPNTCEDAVLIDEVAVIDADIMQYAGNSSSKCGTGGMQTKIHAAQKATEHGIDMVIANGKNPEILYDILQGKKIGTYFIAEK